MELLLTRINKSLVWIPILLSIFCLYSCAVMPKMDLKSGDVSIIESSSSNKFNIYVRPINADTVQSNDSHYHYVLGKGDQVIIYVWGHPEFDSPLGANFNGDASNLYTTSSAEVSETFVSHNDLIDRSTMTYTVDHGGNVFVPMIGRVHMEGKDVDAIQAEITRRITKYVVNPQVVVRMAGFRSKKINIIGEVSNPKSLFLTDVPLDLSSALISAGWLNLGFADVKSIYVMRLKDKNTIDAYQLDATSAGNMLYANMFIMQPNDIVFVSTSGIGQLNRVITPINNTAQAVWFAANIVPFGNKLILQ